MKTLSLVILSSLLGAVFFSTGVAAQGFALAPGVWRPLADINSPYNEYSVSVSPDGSFMIFSSDRPGGLGAQDLWITRLSNGGWTIPENMTELNSGELDQTPFITYDGKAVVFGSDRDGGYGASDLYVSFRQGDQWSGPVNLGPVINGAAAEKMPSVSMDNKELYFCRMPIDYTTRSVLNAKARIFVSKRSDSIWMAPQDIGGPVNTNALDCAPRIMPDDLTLLFASARAGGHGRIDIWRAERNNRFSAWTRVSNLAGVNTTNNDVYFASTVDGVRLYQSYRGLESGNFDLFECAAPEKVTAPTITLQGVISNRETGKIATAEVLVESFGDRDFSVRIQNDPVQGRYSITLPAGERYSLTYEGTGYIFQSRELDVRGLGRSFVTNIRVGLDPVRTGGTIVVETLYFDPDSWGLRPDSELALAKIVKILKDNPTIRLLIKGHVAKVSGGRLDPLALSEQRAGEVRKFLTGKGIDPRRLEAKGYGDSRPVAENDTEAGRSKNRRTEFEILGPL